MEKLIVGLQLYTLRDFCKGVDLTSSTFKRIREMGYRVVEIGSVTDVDIKNLKKLLDDYELYAWSNRVSYSTLINQTEKIIEESKIIGCEAIICPILPQELYTKEGYLKVANEFQRIAPILKKEGLKLAFHNHSLELEKFEGKTGLEILLENAPELEIQIDTYWIQHGGGDPAEWIEKFSGRVSSIHLKDMGIIKGEQVMPPVGEGNLNWRRIIEACKKAGVKYGFVEIDQTTIDPFGAVRISLQNLKNLGFESF